MSPQSQSVIATGLVVLLVSASLGLNFGSFGFGLLLCFMGLLTGVNLMAVGVWMADNTSANIPASPPGIHALTTFPRRNLAVVGIMAASSAVTAVAGEASPVLCGAFFALLLLGVSLITIGVLALRAEADDGVVKEAA
ncbi:unnamed protein product [Urochloa decumbens]|uniref:Uncharacterized protein n=1 Tax=Urochloa decumbens TaxID=240449 RepID=A0ABC9BW18_9POAL